MPCRGYPSRRQISRRHSLESLESRILLSSSLIPIMDHQDLVVDSTRDELLIISSTGAINRYDISTGQLLDPIDLNITPGGADISADGQYLYVPVQSTSPMLTLDQVNLDTGTVSAFTTPVSPNAGFYDAAVLADGRVELTTDAANVGQVFVEFNPATQSFSLAAALNTSVRVTNPALIFRSANRESAIFMEPQGNGDAGGIRSFQLATNSETQLESGNLTITSSTTAALSADGALYAVDQPGGVELFNQSGSLLSTETSFHGGIAFSADSKTLYVADPGSDAVDVFDLTNPAVPIVATELALGEPLTNVGPMGNGQIAISPDGAQLFVTTTDGIRVVGAPAHHWSTNITIQVPASATLLQSVSIVATVSSNDPGSDGSVPTGNVTFIDYDATFEHILATVPLQNGSASFNATGMDVGTNTFDVSYSGDANYAFNDSAPGVPVWVTKEPSDLTLRFAPDSPDSVYDGESFTLQLLVGDSQTPATGTAQLWDIQSGQQLAASDLVNGSTTFSVSESAPGTYTFRADYPGDSQFASGSAFFTVSVGQIPTSVSFVSVPDNSDNLTVQLITPGQTSPDGTFSLAVDGQPFATVDSDFNYGYFDLSTLSAGPHTFVATFSGDSEGNFAPAVSDPVVLAVLAPSSISLAQTATVETTDQPFNLVASVTPNVPGSVVFSEDGEPVGTVTVSHGQAVFPFTGTDTYSHQFSAEFDPDGDYLHTTDQVTINFFEPTVLDLLALYTPQELESAGSVQGILNTVQAQISDANLAFSNSLIPVSVRLVALEPTKYNESGDIDTDWRNLANSKGALASVPALRNRVGADLVVLLDSAPSPGSTADTELEGEASELTSSFFGSAIQSEVDSIVIDANAPEGDYVLAHEIGHTLGAAHAVGDPGGPGISPDAHGYRFTGDDGTVYHDVMAYYPGTAIPYYSNPNVTYEGEPVGAVGTANLARVFDITAPSVAAYRNAKPFGAITSADATSISGWVYDPQDFTQGSTIQIDIDGVESGTLDADDYVGDLFSRYGSPDHGFTWTLPALTPGKHKISIYALDAMTGLPELIAQESITENHLAWEQRPLAVTAGQTFAKPLKVAVSNSAGHVATDSQGTLTIAIAAGPAGGTLTGTANAALVDGVATFDDLLFARAGVYTLKVSDGAMILKSVKFTVNPGAAAQFEFSASPAGDIAAGKTLGIAISATDALGNPATLERSRVSLTLEGTAGGVFNRMAAAAFSHGVAAFKGLFIGEAGSYTLVAGDGGTVATAAQFTVDPAAAAKILFVQQPTDAIAGEPIDPAITTEIVDRFGNAVSSDNAGITLSEVAHPKGALAPAGTWVQNATAGIASFGDITLFTAGSYSLRASQGKITGLSQRFTIGAASASQLAVISPAQAGNSRAGGRLIPIKIAVEDFYGNLETGSSAAIQMAITAGPDGGELAGETAIEAEDGNAVFMNLSLDTAGAYTLGVSAAGLAAAELPPITVKP